ncbi:hypothetical protein IMCC3317_37120 [Kordia antarctica]|uniref:Thioredoxin domain-containing protein n=1 Tax=Kordia antarctica TaxID=1218801 RepID=A0A7L4ZP99_9FLAO|nr:TlpA disulfide reductase family protein [Kordia antarctica]QHI38321.1 hypothetical protein IMCC3317_37120 [Kordia antarctica]
MKKETRKKYLRYFLNSLLGMCIYIFYGVIFNGNHPKMFPATCATFFLISLWMTNKRQSKSKDISISFLMSFIFLLMIFISDNLLTVAGQIIYVIMMPLSELMGSWAKKQKLQFAYFPLLLLFVTFLVRPNLIHYFWNTDSFKNKKTPEISFYALNEEKVTFTNKVTVIDLWSTSCGVCFRKFPEFEKLKQDFEGNENIKFYSANVPLKNDTREKTLATIKRLNYDYETLFAEKFEMIRDSLGINGFPYLLIIKNDTIRYLGDMETDRKIVLTNTKDVIQNLLE